MSNVTRKYRRPTVLDHKTRSAPEGQQLWLYRRGKIRWVRVQILDGEAGLRYLRPIQEFTGDAVQGAVRLNDPELASKVVSVTFSPGMRFDLRRMRRTARKVRARKAQEAYLAEMITRIEKAIPHV